MFDLPPGIVPLLSRLFANGGLQANAAPPADSFADRFAGQQPVDAPPSTNDPFSSEPQIVKNGVPIPRPRPPEANANPPPDSFADRFNGINYKGDRAPRVASFNDRFDAAP